MPTSTSLSLQVLDYLDTYTSLSPAPLASLTKQIKEDIQNGELPRKFDVTRLIREKTELQLTAMIKPLEGRAFLTGICIGKHRPLNQHAQVSRSLQMKSEHCLGTPCISYTEHLLIRPVNSSASKHECEHELHRWSYHHSTLIHKHSIELTEGHSNPSLDIQDTTISMILLLKFLHLTYRTTHYWKSSISREII
jgi:hypothetical protein